MILHRTLCEVLEELRTCNETRNFSYFLALLEESQSMANKMEAGLGRRRNKINALEEEIEELKEKINEK